MDREWGYFRDILIGNSRAKLVMAPKLIEARKVVNKAENLIFHNLKS